MTAPLLTEVRAADTLPSRLEDSWDEPLPCEHTLRAAHEELQGAWFSVSGRRDAELLFSGNRFTVRFADGHIYMGVFELTPTAVPRLMLMCVEEGPDHHKGKTAVCIYEVTGRTLRWCAASPGHRERLTAFPAEDHPQYLCLLFSREQRL